MALGALGREALFHVRRQIAGVSKQEHLDYLTGTATLVKTLKDAGVSMDELKAVAGTLKRPSIRDNLLPTAKSDALKPSERADRRVLDYDGSNYEMKSQAGLDLEAAQARLDVAVRQLKDQLGDHEQAAFEKAQEIWENYRNAVADAARAEYDGGTHAGLAAALTALAETQRRMNEIRADLAEREQR